jgi:L-amino acid N-acyltransferase YncA/8-oxo-dGTP pyrophosphatase MutT (NUDIX family)
VVIRAATQADADRIWAIFQAVVAGRDTYAFPPDTPRDAGVGYWFGPDVTSFVADVDGRVVGMYKIIANRPGLGAHVANASFMVDPSAAGRGIGRALGAHSLQHARALGYEAMQFNFVVSTNRRAVALWQSLGFRIVGTIPRAFQHGTRGLVDAYVMHRFLDDIVVTFGTAPTAARITVRPSAYAVVVDSNRRVLVVMTPNGGLLPGGGIDADEVTEAAVEREVAEECALRVHVGGGLGYAVEFVHAVSEARCFEKRSHFLTAHVIAPLERPPEHDTRWMRIDTAIHTLTYGSHAWALKRWTRLNT